MTVFHKTKQYRGFEVVNSYFRTKYIRGFGKIKLLVREIDVYGEIRKTMPMTSAAIAFYPYEDKRDLLRNPSPLYRELKWRYPDCTPHHDVDGFYIIPTPIHRAFKHFGAVGAEQYYQA